MATKALFFGTLLYLITAVFSFLQLPGTLELGIFSIPTVSILLLRYYRVSFKSEKNIFLKYFVLIMSVFISLSILIPIFFFSNNSFENINEFKLITWIMLILLNIVYYLYYAVFTHGKRYKTGYIILILTSLIFLIETMVNSSFREFSELNYIIYFSLIILAGYIYFQFMWNKPMPKLFLGYTLLIGAIVVYSIDIFYLVLG